MGRHKASGLHYEKWNAFIQETIAIKFKNFKVTCLILNNRNKVKGSAFIRKGRSHLRWVRLIASECGSCANFWASPIKSHDICPWVWFGFLPFSWFPNPHLVSLSCWGCPDKNCSSLQTAAFCSWLWIKILSFFFFFFFLVFSTVFVRVYERIKI